MTVKADIQENGTPWKYTDDLIAGVIVVGYIAGKASGIYEIPPEMVTLVLGWVFGKNI